MDIVTHSMAGMAVAGAAANRKELLYPALLCAALSSALIDAADMWLWVVDITLYYEYHLVRDKAVPEVNPMNPKYRLFIQAWKRLPLGFANLIGPRLSP